MTPDPTFEESYAAFLTESQDILQRIEHELLSLRDGRSIDKVHRLMRSAHTLKGAAASVELEAVKQVAHTLEDIFKALYNPNVIIDAEVEAFLFEGYECLRLALITELTGGQISEEEVLNRAAEVMAKLQEKLGDEFNPETPIPNSVELGFDVVHSMFEVTVGQRLQELEQTVNHGSLPEVVTELWAKADTFLGLAESVGLTGFAAIAQATLAALEAHPEQAVAIAQLAIADFSQGRASILAGDRQHGGSPSAELQALAHDDLSSASGFDEVPFGDEHAFPEAEFDREGEFPVTEALGAQAVIDASLDDLFGEVAAATEHEESAAENAIEPNSQPEEVWESPVSADEQTTTPTSPVNLSVSRSPTYFVATPVEPTEPVRVEPVRVDVEQLKHLDYLAGDLLINQSQQTTQDQQFRTVVQELRSSVQQHQQTMYELHDRIERLLNQFEQGRTLQPLVSLASLGSDSSWSAHTPFTARFDPLEMERYNDLRLLLRSAVNQTAQLDGITETVDQLTRQSRRTLETQRRVLKQVRDDLTSLRMHPLQDLFNRFPRLLQQLAAAYGKKVELILSGTDVLVDKAVAEKLYDPLLHLIRNAFDHGIEPPEVRRAQGKPETGRIEIRANHQGNQTVIEVKDDGQGVDLQRIAQRAIELKLITADYVKTLPESQLLDLLFQPRFSTATQVSDLSGRGIGLDVVNSQIQALNGSVAISTTPQQGTTFSLKIPLSLTTTKLLVCQANGFAYALPVERVEQVVVPSVEQLSVLGGEQVVIHWRQGSEDLMVPVYDLSELVHYAELSAQLGSDANSGAAAIPWRQQITQAQLQSTPVLLLQTICGLRGLRVDWVLGEQELVIRSLGAAIAPPPYIYGCCILGNHRSALAIDVEVLLQVTTELDLSNAALPERLTPTLAQMAAALDPQEDPSTPHRVTGQGNLPTLPRSRAVLIVDDSLTLRRNLSLVFKGAGYDVLEAEDGLEALTQLRQHPEVDLILCDIEMPRLNGFEFLSQSQQDPALAAIPVVMLTSRSSAKHRQLALALGAVAYFTKPYDHKELLASVDRLLQKSVQR